MATEPSEETLLSRVRDLLRPGDVVVVGDGTGAPRHVLSTVAEAARHVGGVHLVVGWSLGDWPDALAPDAFASVRTVMGGYGTRAKIADGAVGYLPARMGAMPSLLRGPLRPRLAVVSARPQGSGLAWTAEVSWMAAAVEAADAVLVEVNEALPRAGGAIEVLSGRLVGVVDRTTAPPTVPASPADETSRAIGALVADLVPEGAAVQFGPGKIGDACLAALARPVVVDSGVVNDAVVDLQDRGLLAAEPTAAYVIGTERVLDWADGRSLVHRVEHTHDITRLSSRPFFALNTALEIDHHGQVNVEAVGGHAIGGVGGHGDYAVAASRSAGGLSVVALPRERGGRPTLVENLGAPVSTASSDVDVVVCEAGLVDLRGLSRSGRAHALTRLWEA